MGFFDNAKVNVEKAHNDAVLKNLKPKDGKVHVLMIMSFSKIANQAFGCDDKFTNEIDSVLSEMQSRGYEIVDIKLGVLPNQGLTGQREGYLTCVMYR